METKVREPEIKPQIMAQDFEVPDRSDSGAGKAWSSLFLSIVFGVLITLAYGLFGHGIDRVRFASNVTPVRVELNSISDHRRTAESMRNLQL